MLTNCAPQGPEDGKNGNMNGNMWVVIEFADCVWVTGCVWAAVAAEHRVLVDIKLSEFFLQCWIKEKSNGFLKLL